MLLHFLRPCDVGFPPSSPDKTVKASLAEFLNRQATNAIESMINVEVISERMYFTENEGKQEKMRNQEFSRDYVIACNCTYDINKEKLPYLVNDVTETPGDCENSANHRRAAVFEIDVEMKLESKLFPL